MASRISRRGRPEDVQWLWEREGRSPDSSIRHRRGRFGMLFSCSVGYRASTSEPLFRRFLYGVLGSSHSSGPTPSGILTYKTGRCRLVGPGLSRGSGPLIERSTMMPGAIAVKLRV